MAWDFSSDSAKLTDVSKELKQVAVDIRTKTQEIYKIIESDIICNYILEMSDNLWVLNKKYKE